eukprot:7565237-Pyramimonas_sp.AAC.1
MHSTPQRPSASTSCYGSFRANNGKGALNTPESRDPSIDLLVCIHSTTPSRRRLMKLEANP